MWLMAQSWGSGVHTILVTGAGFVLLVVCLLAGRFVAGGMALATLWFLPLWLLGAACNMWVGVTRAGYSVAAEFPIFLAVFGVPAAAALAVRWLLLRG